MYNFSVDWAVYVCRYIESIAFGTPSTVDAVTAADVQRLRNEFTYMLLTDKDKSWDEETEIIQRIEDWKFTKFFNFNIVSSFILIFCIINDPLCTAGLLDILM